MSSSEAAAAPSKDPPPAAAAAAQQEEEDDVFSEPDYDHLDLSFATMEDCDEADDLKKPKKGGKGGIQPPPQYIVGTLIVRIVAARDLEVGWWFYEGVGVN
jgi:hypothetical protein